jgi:protease IV
MRTAPSCSQTTLAAVLLVLLSGATRAQQIARPLNAGVEPPVRSLLLDDDATALSGNPGSLAFAGKLQLDFVHESGTGGSDLSGNGVYLAGGLPHLVLGTAFEWTRPGETCAALSPCGRRFSLGAGVQAGPLGIGATYHSHSSGESTDLDRLTSWDLGAVVRPARYLALGFAALDVNAPFFAGTRLPRRYAASLGIRPFEERLSLTADAYVSECSGTPAFFTSPGPRACGAGSPDLRFSADLAIVPGVHVVGQLGYGAQVERVSGQVGLQFDGSHLGIRAAHEFHPGGGRSGFKVRLSQQSQPAYVFGSRMAVEIDLDRALRRPSLSLFDLVLGRGPPPDPLALTLSALRRLALDRRSGAVVLRTSGLPLGMGSAEELRTGIGQLRAAGKKVIFYLESGGDLEYYVASSADRVFAAPQAVLSVNGFSATAIFAAAGLDKLGVKAEFFRVGAYKTAPDLFTRSESSSEQREVQEALLDDVYGRFVRAVVERRGVTEAKLKGLLDKGLLKPGEAVNEKLLDGLVYPDQLGEEVGKLFGADKMHLEKIDVEPPDAKQTRWGGRDRIGIVRVEGDILAQGGDVLGAVKVASAYRIARRIRALADDPGILAIVVRIDSPGGDGNASDLIWRELVRARREKKKPVIASMGDVAASGGYYVAVGADEIFAEPSTITGSIGVFIGHFDASALYGKLGLAFSTARRGASADLFSTTRALTAKERVMLQDWVESFYAQFVARVAEGRRMTPAAVDAVARGRVWSGSQAKERGLIDALGGFTEAVARAKERAGLSRDAEVVLDDEGRPGADLLDAAFSGALSRAIEESPIARALPQGDAARVVRAVGALGEPGTLRARMPYDLELR